MDNIFINEKKHLRRKKVVDWEEKLLAIWRVTEMKNIKISVIHNLILPAEFSKNLT
jgi:hypothetical protein